MIESREERGNFRADSRGKAQDIKFVEIRKSQMNGVFDASQWAADRARKCLYVTIAVNSDDDSVDGTISHYYNITYMAYLWHWQNNSIIARREDF